MELRIAGILLLFAGWIIMLASVVLLPSLVGRITFSLAGFAVEMLGLVLLARAHIRVRKRRDA